MVIKKPKITVRLPEGLKVRKSKAKKGKAGKGVRGKKDRREYTADRCDNKEIEFEEGAVYYGGAVDTTEAVDDVLSILRNKGMI